MSFKSHIMLIFGTRPEAIKMAPVIREFRKYPGKFSVTACVTAQHRRMLDQVLEIFKIMPDIDLNLMQPNQSLAELHARALTEVDSVIREHKPDWVFVQGDTTTVMAASTAAFYNGVRVGHVEAGLRTKNKRAPFPEEINRRVTSVIADLHFAPTEMAKKALLTEGVSESSVYVTGNTVIDALLWMKDELKMAPPEISADILNGIRNKKLVLVTGHRRESFGRGFESICLAIRDLIIANQDICVIYPVHLNPNVQEPVRRLLGNIERVHLMEPLSYAPFVWLMDKSHIILTDSGGIQEEAPSLGKPVLVMREVTERPEGIEAGCVKLTGVTRLGIVDNVMSLLTDERLYKSMSQAKNPYGDGTAAERIVRIVAGITN